jgi:hypothetical protein
MSLLTLGESLYDIYKANKVTDLEAKQKGFD